MPYPSGTLTMGKLPILGKITFLGGYFQTFISCKLNTTIQYVPEQSPLGWKSCKQPFKLITKILPEGEISSRNKPPESWWKKWIILSCVGGPNSIECIEK